MRITRENDFGNRTVCTDSLTASSGLLSCDVSSVSDDDRYLYVEIYSAGELKTIETIELNTDYFSFDGVNGSFLAFFMLLLIICFFSEDKQALVISIVLGFIACIAFGLINGAIFGVYSSGIWLIIAAIIFLWKLSQEERG